MAGFENLSLALQYDVEEVTLFSLFEEGRAPLHIYELDAAGEVLVRVFVVLKDVVEDFNLLQVASELFLIFRCPLVLVGGDYFLYLEEILLVMPFCDTRLFSEDLVLPLETGLDLGWP